jgi:5-methylcytosine-specific restriction enzyme subunit McrC
VTIVGHATKAWVVREWETRIFPGAALTPSDRTLAQALSQGGLGRLQVDELLGGIRIDARSWVGVVRFTHVDVHVVPKLAGDHLGLVRLIDYATGLDALERYPAVNELAVGGARLFDLLALLFAESCEWLLRRGLHAEYRETEDSLPVVRGRILGDRQLLKRFGRLDRLECRYDEHTSDIAENQIIAAALMACAARVRDERVGLRIRRLRGIFAEASDPSALDLRSIRSDLVYNRLTERYRESHSLSWLILDWLGIDDLYAPGSARCFSFLLDMNVLFELFLRRWLASVLIGTPLRLDPKRGESSVIWNCDAARPYGHVVPDMVVRGPGDPPRRVALDAKYKLYDQKKLNPADIYQAFVYGFALSPAASSAPPVSFVLYPASTAAIPVVRLQVRKIAGEPGGQLVALGVHIPTALDEAEGGRIGPLSQALRDRLLDALTPRSAQVADTPLAWPA